MSGAMIDVDLGEFEEASRRLKSLGGFERAELTENIAALLESSTRERIHETKATASGDAWPEWSVRYAKTRQIQHSLLVGEGDLLDSVTSFHDDGAAGVGSNLVYFASHQFGDEERGIPERAPLGVSGEDRSDILDLVNATLAETLQ